MSSSTEVPNQPAETPPPAAAPSGADASAEGADPDEGAVGSLVEEPAVGLPEGKESAGSAVAEGVAEGPGGDERADKDAVAAQELDGKPVAEPPRRLPDYLRARKPRRKVELAGSRPRSGPCVFCKDEVDPADHAWCVRCKVFLHRDCANELGRCPTLGCNGDLLNYRRRPLESAGHRGITILGLTPGQIAYWLVALGIPLFLTRLAGELDGLIVLLSLACAFLLHIAGFRAAVDWIADCLPMPSFAGLRSARDKAVHRSRELGPGPPIVLLAGLTSTVLSAWPPGLEGDGLADPAARACLAVTLLGTVLMIALRDPRQAASETAEAAESESGQERSIEPEPDATKCELTSEPPFEATRELSAPPDATAGPESSEAMPVARPDSLMDR